MTDLVKLAKEKAIERLYASDGRVSQSAFEEALLEYGAACLDAAEAQPPEVWDWSHPVDAIRRYREKIAALKAQLMGGEK